MGPLPELAIPDQVEDAILELDQNELAYIGGGIGDTAV